MHEELPGLMRRISTFGFPATRDTREALTDMGSARGL